MQKRSSSLAIKTISHTERRRETNAKQKNAYLNSRLRRTATASVCCQARARCNASKSSFRFSRPRWTGCCCRLFRRDDAALMPSAGLTYATGTTRRAQLLQRAPGAGSGQTSPENRPPRTPARQHSSPQGPNWWAAVRGGPFRSRRILGGAASGLEACATWSASILGHSLCTGNEQAAALRPPWGGPGRWGQVAEAAPHPPKA